MGLVVLATTFLSAVPALTGPISFLLTWFIPVPVLDWFTAVALLILGSALQRRMRVGWVATTFLTCVSLVLFIVAIVSLILAHQPGLTPLDLVAQGVNALQLTILIVALVRTRRTYHVHMRPGNVWRALAITTIGTGTSTALIALLVLVIHPSAITGILLAQEGRQPPRPGLGAVLPPGPGNAPALPAAGSPHERRRGGAGASARVRPAPGLPRLLRHPP